MPVTWISVFRCQKLTFLSVFLQTAYFISWHWLFSRTQTLLIDLVYITNFPEGSLSPSISCRHCEWATVSSLLWYGLWVLKPKPRICTITCPLNPLCHLSSSKSHFLMASKTHFSSTVQEILTWKHTIEINVENFPMPVLLYMHDMWTRWLLIEFLLKTN